jgi:hypothetical protein
MLFIFLVLLSCDSNDDSLENIDDSIENPDDGDDIDNTELSDLEGIWKENYTKIERYNTQSGELFLSETIRTSYTGNYILFQINSDSTFSKKYIKKNETDTLNRTGTFEIDESEYGTNSIRLHYPDSVNLDFNQGEASFYLYRFNSNLKTRLELSASRITTWNSQRVELEKIYDRQE